MVTQLFKENELNILDIVRTCIKSNHIKICELNVPKTQNVKDNDGEIWLKWFEFINAVKDNLDFVFFMIKTKSIGIH